MGLGGKASNIQRLSKKVVNVHKSLGPARNTSKKQKDESDLESEELKLNSTSMALTSTRSLPSGAYRRFPESRTQSGGPADTNGYENEVGESHERRALEGEPRHQILVGLVQSIPQPQAQSDGRQPRGCPWC